MASIVKRETTNGVRYDVRYRDPAGKVRTKTFRRSEDARKFSNTTEADKVRGTWLDPDKGRLTFADWWDLWWPTTVNLRPTSRPSSATTRSRRSTTRW